MPPVDQSSQEHNQGAGKEILERFNARVGQRVEIETTDGLLTTGLLIPRYEHADSEYIVLKLKSGYNMGLKAGNIKRIRVVETPASAPKTESRLVAKSSGKKNLLLFRSRRNDSKSRGLSYRCCSSCFVCTGSLRCDTRIGRDCKY